jgi:hypothetical protein
LNRNYELLRKLRAVALRLNHTLVQIIEDACIEYFAPDLKPKPESGWGSVFSGIPMGTQELSDEVLTRLRGVHFERGIPIAEVIEAACLRWVDENVWKIDQHGAALFRSENPASKIELTKLGYCGQNYWRLYPGDTPEQNALRAERLVLEIDAGRISGPPASFSEPPPILGWKRQASVFDF